MPVLGSSYNQGRHRLIKWIVQQKPTKIFEFGVGRGVFGTPVRKAIPHCILVGCDIFQPAVEYHATRIEDPYDSVFQADMLSALARMTDDYDTFLFGDVLEHVEKVAALEFLEACVAHTKSIAIRIPVGNYPQKGKFGNPHEAHLWSFMPSDLTSLKNWTVDFSLISPLRKGFETYIDTMDRDIYGEYQAFVGGFGLVKK